eukprot:13777633-Heterocapsa_arctica.AAC.1
MPLASNNIENHCFYTENASARSRTRNTGGSAVLVDRKLLIPVLSRAAPSGAANLMAPPVPPTPRTMLALCVGVPI